MNNFPHYNLSPEETKWFNRWQQLGRVFQGANSVKSTTDFANACLRNIQHFEDWAADQVRVLRGEHKPEKKRAGRPEKLSSIPLDTQTSGIVNRDPAPENRDPAPGDRDPGNRDLSNRTMNEPHEL